MSPFGTGIRSCQTLESFNLCCNVGTIVGRSANGGEQLVCKTMQQVALPPEKQKTKPKTKPKIKPTTKPKTKPKPQRKATTTDPSTTNFGHNIYAIDGTFFDFFESKKALDEFAKRYVPPDEYVRPLVKTPKRPEGKLVDFCLIRRDVTGKIMKIDPALVEKGPSTGWNPWTRQCRGKIRSTKKSATRSCKRSRSLSKEGGNSQRGSSSEHVFRRRRVSSVASQTHEPMVGSVVVTEAETVSSSSTSTLTNDGDGSVSVGSSIASPVNSNLPCPPLVIRRELGAVLESVLGGEYRSNPLDVVDTEGCWSLRPNKIRSSMLLDRGSYDGRAQPNCWHTDLILPKSSGTNSGVWTPRTSTTDFVTSSIDWSLSHGLVHNGQRVFFSETDSRAYTLLNTLLSFHQSSTVSEFIVPLLREAGFQMSFLCGGHRSHPRYPPIHVVFGPAAEESGLPDIVVQYNTKNCQRSVTISCYQSDVFSFCKVYYLS